MVFEVLWDIPTERPGSIFSYNPVPYGQLL